MKLGPTHALVQKMSRSKVPEPGVSFNKWQPTDKPDYLVYDSSRKSPPGFALRVGPGRC